MSLHFSKLRQDELTRKVASFLRSDSVLTIWERGKKQRYYFEPGSLERSDNHFYIKNKGDDSIPFNKCMGHFSLNGLSFLFEASISSAGEFYKVFDIENFYKAERRTSFRLLTYPHKEVYLNFTLENVPEIEEGNVVSIDTGQSETGLFINFLDLLNDKTNPETKSSQGVKLRVQDLSVTGLCFEVGELERNYLEKHRTLENVNLNFEELKITIPKVSVVYIKEHRNFLTNIKVFRIGIEFHNLDEKTEQKISKKINHYIHKLEEEYEKVTK